MQQQLLWRENPLGALEAQAHTPVWRRRLLETDRLELEEVRIESGMIVASNTLIGSGRQHSLPWPWAPHFLRFGSGCCRRGWAFEWTRRDGAGLRPCPRCLVSRWHYGACGTSDGRDMERRRQLLRRRYWWLWVSIATCETLCTWASSRAGWGCGWSLDGRTWDARTWLRSRWRVWWCWAWLCSFCSTRNRTCERYSARITKNTAGTSGAGYRGCARGTM